MTDRLHGEHVLVTGAYGCIGVWVLRELLARGATVVAFDLASGSPRAGLVLEDEHHPRLLREQGDIADLAGLERILDRLPIRRIIHLAALQVPFCRADPPGGAAVNVVGTANVFEAAARRPDQIKGVVYASSIAAYDAAPAGAAASMTAAPGTIYGVYKRANEQMARVYANERGLATIGLRPHTVFGPGRDQGLTSAPTMAMLAAAAGRSYLIPYSGRAQFQYAPDVAAAFIQAAEAAPRGAAVCNLGGHVASLDDVAATINAAAPHAAGGVTVTGDPLAFPASVEPTGLSDALGGDPVETPFTQAIDETIAAFRRAIADGRIEEGRIPS